jgi:hypothetical protein
MGDDCVNIHGDYHMITRCEGTKLRVLAKGTMNIQRDDPAELVLYTGQRLPDAQVVSVQATGAIDDEERLFLPRQNMDADLKSGRSLGRAYDITLDREVVMPMGSVVCSANRVGNGFSVKGCDFGFNRSRGLDFQDAQIGLPTLEAEQGIRVQTALIRRRERGHRRTQAGLANRIDVLLLSFTSLKVNISRCFLERFYLSFKGLAVD